MVLVELLLPLYDNTGARLAADLFAETRRELVAHFGGLTAFSRTPAEGLWEREPGQVQRDEVVVFEVMVEDLDRSWWAAYRKHLEARFRQESLIVRATGFEPL